MLDDTHTAAHAPDTYPSITGRRSEGNKTQCTCSDAPPRAWLREGKVGPAYEDRYHAAAETLAQRLLGEGEPRRRGDGRERELQALKLNRSASTPKPPGEHPPDATW